VLGDEQGREAEGCQRHRICYSMVAVECLGSMKNGGRGLVARGGARGSRGQRRRRRPRNYSGAEAVGSESRHRRRRDLAKRREDETSAALVPGLRRRVSLDRSNPVRTGPQIPASWAAKWSGGEAGYWKSRRPRTPGIGVNTDGFYGSSFGWVTQI
jgi:hypothetical protein